MNNCNSLHYFGCKYKILYREKILMGMNLQGKIKHLFNKLNEVMKQASRTQKQPELVTINDRTNSAHGKMNFYDR